MIRLMDRETQYNLVFAAMLILAVAAVVNVGVVAYFAFKMHATAQEIHRIIELRGALH